MRLEPRRNFTLVDAMAFVGSTAAAFAWVHAYYDWQYLALTWGWYTRRRYAVEIAQDSIRVAWPFLLAWALTTLALRARRPRPEHRRLARQPGLVAGCATILATTAVCWPAIIGALAGLNRLDRFTHQPPVYWGNLVTGIGLPEAIGLTVAASWLTLASVVGWHPEPSWVDRAGRALGWCWIVVLAVRGALQVALLFR
jgi:hypothetical protein